MKRIYAPWRHKYVSKTTRSGDRKKQKKDCVFCYKFKSNEDKKNLILKRYNNSVIIMNLHPYNAGHLMVLPCEHKAELSDLSSKVRSELINVVNIAIEALKKTMNPDGFNVGINLGMAGGGGLPSHLHFHVLPRWTGDTNFLATLDDTKIICSDFDEIYELLKKELKNKKIK
ncbi:HIT domain-containing protein [Candidatus Dependentiae bacterium]|nr:HIT domain-containing protein [Candidatus Dependentiae bacterium]